MNITRSLFIARAFACVAGAVPPNVLVVITDDQVQFTLKDDGKTFGPHTVSVCRKSPQGAGERVRPATRSRSPRDDFRRIQSPVSDPPPGYTMSRRLFTLLPALALAISLGCGGKPSPDTTPEPPPAPTTAAKPPTDPNAPSADRTFTYWQEVARVQHLAALRLAALAESKPDEVIKLLTAAAKVIDELPTEKVDPDAVAVGTGLAEDLRQRAAGKPTTADASARARTTKAALSTRYSREFPALDAVAKEPVFQIARDLGRPTLAQELARLKGEVAKLDAEIKPLNDKLTAEITTRDTLQSQADGLRARLKEQTEDADLKRVREEVLADAVKEVEAKKKEIDALTKQVNALRTRKSEYDRLALEVTAILTESEPAKAEKLPLDRLERLRVQADRVTEKLDAQKK